MISNPHIQVAPLPGLPLLHPSEKNLGRRNFTRDFSIKVLRAQQNAFHT